MEASDIIQLGIMLATAGALFFTVHNFRQQLQLNFFAEYTKRYQEIVLNFPESINRDDFDLDSLDDEERNKTLRYMRAYFDLCSEEYFLWTSNHINEKTWHEWESGIKYAFSKKAFRDAWARITLDTIYYKDFSSFVHGCIDESTAPVTVRNGGFMRFNVTALSIASGLLWGAAMLIVASAHAIWPTYGGSFLELASSIYSGYDPAPGIGSIIIGTLYGLVDGAIGGAVFGWLYNFLARGFPSTVA